MVPDLAAQPPVAEALRRAKRGLQLQLGRRAGGRRHRFRHPMAACPPARRQHDLFCLLRAVRLRLLPGAPGRARAGPGRRPHARRGRRAECGSGRRARDALLVGCHAGGLDPQSRRWNLLPPAGAWALPRGPRSRARHRHSRWWCGLREGRRRGRRRAAAGGGAAGGAATALPWQARGLLLCTRSPRRDARSVCSHWWSQIFIIGRSPCCCVA
mmetsp:Transcript_53991/g.149711  ORF Transcript_53991/g.149711 Transcript_53991/m.149711 type:complete len:213 (+) Transcript_53991:681-1319(+)